ncbi:MAG: RDD family protein [Thermodesulfobacteriota bacterium]
MKCKRCRAQVPDEIDICPYCHEDLSSLRELLKSFYEEQVFISDEEKIEKSPGQEEIPVINPLINKEEERLEKEKLSEKLAQSEEAKEEVKRPISLKVSQPAGFWLRLMAFAIDGAIIFFTFIIFVIIGLIAVEMMPGEIREIPLLRLLGIILPALFPLGCLLALSYFTFFHLVWGQTIGKMIFGLRVVQTDGHPLSTGRALLRAVAYFLSAFPLGLGFLWVGFSSKKRSWHDWIAGTVVQKE